MIITFINTITILSVEHDRLDSRIYSYNVIQTRSLTLSNLSLHYINWLIMMTEYQLLQGSELIQAKWFYLIRVDTTNYDSLLLRVNKLIKHLYTNS